MDLHKLGLTEEEGQVQALNSSLRIRMLPSLLTKVVGHVEQGKVYTFTRYVVNQGFIWYDIGEGWVAETSDLTHDIITWHFPTEYIAITTYFKPTHLGIDLGYNESRGFKHNMPIKAVANGVVEKVWEFGNAGLTARVRTDWGKYSFFHQYKHLSFCNIKEGDELKQGDIIGLMGKTGGNYGYHLHFDLVRCPLGYEYTQKDYTERRKYSINPLDLLRATPENVLSYDEEATNGVKYD